MTAEQWAALVAASLPPLSAEQAAEAGRLARTLDDRREAVAAA